MEARNYLFAVFISYLASFVVYLILPEKILKIHWDPGDLHIHHFTYGIIILALGYPCALFVHKAKTRLTLAVLYGFGLFLIVDEVQMWLWLSPFMSDRFLFRQLPSLIVISLFSLLLLIRHLWKNKSPG